MKYELGEMVYYNVLNCRGKITNIFSDTDKNCVYEVKDMLWGGGALAREDSLSLEPFDKLGSICGE